MASSLGVAIGAVGGFMKYQDGKQMISKGQDGINNFKWNDLNNPFRTQKVSTLGSDLQTEENDKLNSTAIQAMQGAGTRGVIGGTESLVEGSNDVNRKIAANLDEQQKNIDTMASQDDTQIRGMKEKRQGDELSGYGQLLNIGRQEKYGGITDMLNAAGAGAAGMAGGTGTTPTDKTGIDTKGYSDKAAMYAEQYGKYLT